MAEKNIEVKVGLLVAICLGLLVTFIIVLGDVSSSSGAKLYLDVDTSATLKAGAPVKVAGVPAGKVIEVDYRGGEVDLETGKPVFVRVTLAVDTDKLATLRQDTRFYITNQGVLGEKYVEIEPISTTGPALSEGDIVAGEPPLRLEIMAMNANRVLASLSNVLRKNEKAIDEMIVNAADTMATMKRTVDRIDMLLAAATPKVDEVITKAIKRYASLGAKAELMLEGVNKELVSTVESVRAILADAKFLTQQLKDGQGTIGALLSDREMYDDFREMMKDLKRHPWKFIWKE